MDINMLQCMLKYDTLGFVTWDKRLLSSLEIFAPYIICFWNQPIFTFSRKRTTVVLNGGLIMTLLIGHFGYLQWFKRKDKIGKSLQSRVLLTRLQCFGLDKGSQMPAKLMTSGQHLGGARDPDLKISTANWRIMCCLVREREPIFNASRKWT